MKIKILNLYAGIGGNRKLWPDDKIEVTAIEDNHQIADIYMDFFPDDKVYCVDAHKYLLDHYKEFDFIWSSPECVTHTRLNTLLDARNLKLKYPDMRLWQEIIFLKQFFEGKYVVENTIPYYECFLKPTKLLHRHPLWSNYPIENFNIKREFNYVNSSYVSRPPTKDMINKLEEWHGIDLSRYDLKLKFKTKVLRNCVHPKLGLHVFNCAFKEKQVTL